MNDCGGAEQQAACGLAYPDCRRTGVDSDAYDHERTAQSLGERDTPRGVAQGRAGARSHQSRDVAASARRPDAAERAAVAIEKLDVVD